ncbi:MAG: hypothetical protein AAGD11_00165 [Planctomycetota bacterium]
MKKLALFLALAMWASSSSDSQAQVYVSYYQPVPVVQPAPVVYSSYYAPTVVARPVVAAPVVQPVTRVRTRFRPILGGTVTRYRSFYAPAPVVYAY